MAVATHVCQSAGHVSLGSAFAFPDGPRPVHPIAHMASSFAASRRTFPSSLGFQYSSLDWGSRPADSPCADARNIHALGRRPSDEETRCRACPEDRGAEVGSAQGACGGRSAAETSGPVVGRSLCAPRRPSAALGRWCRPSVHAEAAVAKSLRTSSTVRHGFREWTVSDGSLHRPLPCPAPASRCLRLKLLNRYLVVGFQCCSHPGGP